MELIRVFYCSGRTPPPCDSVPGDRRPVPGAPGVCGVYSPGCPVLLSPGAELDPLPVPVLPYGLLGDGGMGAVPGLPVPVGNSGGFFGTAPFEVSGPRPALSPSPPPPWASCSWDLVWLMALLPSLDIAACECPAASIVVSSAPAIREDLTIGSSSFIIAVAGRTRPPLSSSVRCPDSRDPGTAKRAALGRCRIHHFQWSRSERNVSACCGAD
jgi:hypothetical protein